LVIFAEWTNVVAKALGAKAALASETVGLTTFGARSEENIKIVALTMVKHEGTLVVLASDGSVPAPCKLFNINTSVFRKLTHNVSQKEWFKPRATSFLQRTGQPGYQSSFRILCRVGLKTGCHTKLAERVLSTLASNYLIKKHTH